MVSINWKHSRYAWLLLATKQRLEPGKAFRAQYGSEFMCTAESFRGYVYSAASQVGVRASAMVFNNLGHPVVVYVFWKSTELVRPNLPAYPIVKRLRKETK